MDLKQLLSKRDTTTALIAQLMEPVKDAQTALAEVDELINAIISDPVQFVRTSTGKDTGTVDVLIQGVMVKHATAKTVVWDQEKLSSLRKVISQHNDDPDAYMKTKTTYAIDEKRFKDFPEPVKAIFAEARTVKSGSPKITFDLNWR